MSYDHVKDRTSSAVGTEEDGGVLFDETIAAYSQRRERAKDFLIEALVDSHHKAFRAYVQRPQWTTINDDPTPGKLRIHIPPTVRLLLTNVLVDTYQLGITAELDEPFRVCLIHPRSARTVPS